MTETEYKVLIAFMRDGWSHRKIQEKILKIPAPARGGGFETMKILHKYDIYGEHKKMLYGKTVSKEILNSVLTRQTKTNSNNTDNLIAAKQKSALKEIKTEEHNTNNNSELTDKISLKIFSKNSQNPLRKQVHKIAQDLQVTMSQNNFIEQIAKAHKLHAKSQDVQDIFLPVLTRLGFKSEKKGLFENYEVSSLRPDFFKKIGHQTGIIVEVERGRTTANNMDILDIWKCHICRDAEFLFLIVPKLRQNKNNSVDKIFEKVIKRISTFFINANYINVDSYQLNK